MPDKAHIDEFTTEQIARIDEVQNAVYFLCRVITESDELPWDTKYIGEIAEFTAELLAQYGHPAYYPHREEFFSPKRKRNVVKIHDWYGKEN